MQPYGGAADEDGIHEPKPTQCAGDRDKVIRSVRHGHRRWPALPGAL
jgi:hypothetical protein